MHRKTREIPWGQIAGAFTLFVAAVAILVGVSWLGSPASASAPKPAVTHHQADEWTCRLFGRWADTRQWFWLNQAVQSYRPDDSWLQEDILALAKAVQSHDGQAVNTYTMELTVLCTF